jgi:hydrogenase nickel incorporation protein HypA/HybF
MQQVPATGVCKECGEESRLAAFPLQCRSCRSHDLEIIEGEELLVESLELEET